MIKNGNYKQFLLAILGISLLLNIIFVSVEDSCESKLDRIREDRTYDFFNLLRLYAIEETHFEGDVAERITTASVFLRENEGTCNKWGTLSLIALAFAVILDSVFLIFHPLSKFE